jgi:hypothetical protein
MKSKHKKIPWYKKVGRKHATGFLLPADRRKLKEIARRADKSLSRYITRLLEKDIKEKLP